MNDSELIERCIAVARQAAERGNHPFGALVVCEGEILAEGENSVVTAGDPSAHAEVVAIRNASRALGRLELSGCSLYSSAEPCLMCSTLIRLVGMSRVVFAAASPGGYGGYSSLYPILGNDTIPRFGQRPEVVAGLLAQRSEALWRELGWPPQPRGTL